MCPPGRLHRSSPSTHVAFALRALPRDCPTIRALADQVGHSQTSKDARIQQCALPSAIFRLDDVLPIATRRDRLRGRREKEYRVELTRAYRVSGISWVTHAARNELLSAALTTKTISPGKLATHVTKIFVTARKRESILAPPNNIHARLPPSHVFTEVRLSCSVSLCARYSNVRRCMPDGATAVQVQAESSGFDRLRRLQRLAISLAHHQSGRNQIFE
ncbi:hypothetical protein B0G75_12022 [Paraburkholderia sp. BL18I3N2]|nr:hypothetical protein B0G75_12022 [Paraburkholderia sp. BL18I3N2]